MSLSDKINNLFEIDYLDSMSDVQGDVTLLIKEAVKELKKNICNSNDFISIDEKIIDKIFGEKLTEDKKGEQK